MLSSSGIGSTVGVERVLLETAVLGNRSHTVLRYALFVADSGYNLKDSKSKVLEFNSKLPEPLPKREIEQTIFVTLKKKYED